MIAVKLMSRINTNAYLRQVQRIKSNYSLKKLPHKNEAASVIMLFI